MSNYATIARRLGLCKESVRGTVESAPSKWVAVSPDSELNYVQKLIEDARVRGVMSKYPPSVGQREGSGIIKPDVDPENIGEFLGMLLGAPTSAESAAFVVSAGSNDKINFKEDAGAEKTATLTAGSYAMGSSSSVNGSLCKEIKTQLESANETDATYTVTYSYTTKKLTITKNSGTIQILWNTGANQAISAKTLLGFTNADTSAALAVTSDSTTGSFAYVHTYTPTTLLPTAYSIWLDRSLATKVYNFCVANQITIDGKPDGKLGFDVGVMFQTEATEDIGSPTFSESASLGFQHVTISLGGSSNSEIKQWAVTLENGLLAKRVMAGTRDPSDFIATQYGAKGSFTIYFADETERAKFLAGTASSLVITVTGGTIGGARTYRLVLTLDDIIYTAFPYGNEDGLLAAKVSFESTYDTTNSRIFKVDLENTVTAY